VSATLSDVTVLDGLAGLHERRTEGTRTTLSVDDDAMPALLMTLARAGATGVTAVPPSLEELFLQHYASEKAYA
jgi:ABC-2 type transport system ATP-binding protein